MVRIIMTPHLICFYLTGIVIARKAAVLPWARLEQGQYLGQIGNMPYGLSIELMDEWSDVADLIFEEYIASTE